MADGYEAVGDDLVVTRGRAKARLSLLVPMADLEVWWAIDDEDWATSYPAILAIMPDTARAHVEAVASTDGVRAAEIVAHWSKALERRLEKALGRFGSGDTTEPPSL